MMKLRATLSRLASRLIIPVLLLPALAVQPAAAQSIASKVEQLGQITVVQVTQLMAARKDGLLTIQFELTNVTDRDQNLRYRFKWLDTQGFTVWDEEPWKPLVVHARQKSLQKVVAPTRAADDFKIELHADNNWGGDGRTPPGPGPGYENQPSYNPRY